MLQITTPTSWWADLRVLSVCRARRIFFSTYLSMNKWTNTWKTILLRLYGPSYVKHKNTHFFFSCLCLTRSAEPKEPFPICSRISYWSIFPSTTLLLHCSETTNVPTKNAQNHNGSHIINLDSTVQGFKHEKKKKKTWAFAVSKQLVNSQFLQSIPKQRLNSEQPLTNWNLELN